MPVFLFGQEAISPGKSALSGYIKDENGEVLIGAHIYIKELETGSSTNNYGFYSLNLDPGSYHVTWSFIGFKSQSRIVEIYKDMAINIYLIEIA